ncbi:hypothetical protein NQ317_002532 [Molorchus minor]|uniref:Uncharacterized protein n=1 Tax=Molorchus minor TaxID=1323400 RepID=A0ABQ9IT34_9CUCU|nr:hypothetical protein NQ317_002532 [Molorchus minor]
MVKTMIEIFEFKERGQKLREAFMKYEAVQDEIECLEDCDEQALQDRDTVENKYYTLIVICLRLHATIMIPRYLGDPLAFICKNLSASPASWISGRVPSLRFLVLKYSPLYGFGPRRRHLTNDLKKKYEVFQRDDGLPVYLKGGFSDKILVITTAILCVVGVADGLFSMLKMAFPKKK